MVKIRNLQFSYKKKILYQDFDIAFDSEHIYGLLGKNGSGKTTLLSLISGGLFAKNGKIDTLGYNPKDRNADMLSQIFYLPEQIILPALSSKNYLKLYTSFYPNFNMSDFEKYAKLFEVEEVKNIGKLSMGQQKKFLLSFGLASNCPLNLLDEPTNGLDIPSKTIFRKMIASCASEDKTFIISTHQVKDIENLIDHVCIVEDAQVALNASIKDINDNLEMSQQNALDGSEIYSQEIGLGQFTVIKENSTAKANSIDLELLFNATIKNKKALNKALNKKHGGVK